MDQKSLIDTCIVLSDLFSDELEVREKQDAELSTAHHLVVCSLRLSKPWPNRKSNRSSVTYRTKLETLEDKEEKKKQFASSISSKFRQIPDASKSLRRNGCCSDQRSFHQLLKAVDENGSERRAIVRKVDLVEPRG